MLDNTISGYRHKVFFKTPGDLWMLKGTSPNVCLTIAPNYRLQNETPTMESSGNVITRRFVGPLLRRYCDRVKTPGTTAKPTTKRLICKGRAIGCTPNDPADDVIRKADDTSNANDVRQADAVKRAAIRYDDSTGDEPYKRPSDIERQCFSIGPKDRPNTRTLRLPWHVGRVYSRNSLISVAEQYRLSLAKERAQSTLNVSLSRNKQVIASGRVVQSPQFHAQNNLPVLYGNVNSRAFAIGEKKHIGQVGHEPNIIKSFTGEETGSSSDVRLDSRLNIQNSLVVCQLHPAKTRSGPTVAKCSDLRCANNNTPEDGVPPFKADQTCQATNEAEQMSGIQDPSSAQSIASHGRSRRVTAQSTSEPDATLLQKDYGLEKNMFFGYEAHVHKAKDP